ncbi:hypothetical protein SUBVAR_05129 [Subdoligranulum variabile DSM 15176]|uniref:Uncharacterized protein n=1 Tax=Subdoligranulum variabile DSM 15176 TaxID=411471 RepID=D1PL92_9FIRM|nr:hypothetical protein SUBVAR_05129 [Subdoligranulum variabile DSM 15176]
MYGLDLYHKTRPLLFHRLTKLAKATQRGLCERSHIRHFPQILRFSHFCKIPLGRSIPFL